MSNKKSNLSYFEKLKDPRWQKKRLEVFELNDWTCTACESKEKTLHVHHKAYKKNAEPWEYDINELDCLCESCHQNETILDELINKALFKYRTNDLSKEYLLGLLQAATTGLVPWDNEIEVFSYEQCEGIATWCGFKPSIEYEENGVSAADIIFAPFQNKYDSGEFQDLRGVINLEELDWYFNEKSKSERVLRFAKNHPDGYRNYFIGESSDDYFGIMFWPKKLIDDVKKIIGVI
jgi:hypothetical protein